MSRWPDPPDTLHVGRLIREHRERAGVSQAELSRRSSVNVNQLNKYERGHHEPTLPVLRRIAAALAVPVDHLVPSEPAEKTA